MRLNPKRSTWPQRPSTLLSSWHKLTCAERHGSRHGMHVALQSWGQAGSWAPPISSGKHRRLKNTLFREVLFCTYWNLYWRQHCTGSAGLYLVPVHLSISSNVREQTEQTRAHLCLFWNKGTVFRTRSFMQTFQVSTRKTNKQSGHGAQLGAEGSRDTAPTRGVLSKPSRAEVCRAVTPFCSTRLFLLF